MFLFFLQYLACKWEGNELTFIEYLLPVKHNATVIYIITAPLWGQVLLLFMFILQMRTPTCRVVQSHIVTKGPSIGTHLDNTYSIRTIAKGLLMSDEQVGGCFQFAK